MPPPSHTGQPLWPIFTQCRRHPPSSNWKCKHSDISSASAHSSDSLVSEYVNLELVFCPIPQLDGPLVPPETPRVDSLYVQNSPTPSDAASADGPAQDDRDADSNSIHEKLSSIQALCERLSVIFPRFSTDSRLDSPTAPHESSEDKDEENDDHLADLINLVQNQKSRKNRRN